MGIALIHYDNQQLWSYDPLFKCTDLKWTITENEALLQVVEQIYGIDDQEYEIQAIRAKQYIGRYVFPVSEQEMEKFIKG